MVSSPPNCLFFEPTRAEIAKTFPISSAADISFQIMIESKIRFINLLCTNRLISDPFGEKSSQHGRWGGVDFLQIVKFGQNILIIIVIIIIIIINIQSSWNILIKENISTKRKLRRGRRIIPGFPTAALLSKSFVIF